MILQFMIITFLLSVSGAIFVGLLRKLSPPTNEVKKLKFILVFLSSLSIPIIAAIIALVLTGIVIGKNVFIVFVLLDDVTKTEVILVLLIASLIALTSLLLKLYVYKKSQIPWVISTVFVGFVISIMPQFVMWLVMLTREGVPFFEIIKDVILLRYVSFAIIDVLSIGYVGAFCSFCAALALTVFPKSKPKNNE